MGDVPRDYKSLMYQRFSLAVGVMHADMTNIYRHVEWDRPG